MGTETQRVARRRFMVHGYHRMSEAGILREDDRVELIDGEIVKMAAIGTKHFACVNRLNRLLVTGVGDGAIVSVQNPARLNESNEPRPDLAVLRTRDYVESLPGPEDVLLLIEVSDTTLAHDRGVKVPLHARAGVREVWISDLNGEKVERYTHPSGDFYRRTELSRKGERLAPEALPNLTVRVEDLLG